jgi:hypothetical protein
MKSKYLIYYVFLLLSIAFNGCSSTTNSNGLKNNGRGLFLVSGTNTPVNDVVTAAIVNSQIRLKGYVVIIGVKQTSKNEQLIKKTFYQNEIMAVHVLNFTTGQKLKKTDVITIENAEIVVFPAMDKRYFKVFVNNSVLRNAIDNALKKGALLTSFGESIALTGDRYFTNGKIFQAMQLAPNVVLDQLSVFIKNKNVIETEAARKHFTFIATDKQSLLLFNDKQGKSLNKSKITIVRSATNIQEITNGNVLFSLGTEN